MGMVPRAGLSVNTLAGAHTGTADGLDIALARIALSVVVGVGLGSVMAYFSRTVLDHLVVTGPTESEKSGQVERPALDQADSLSLNGRGRAAVSGGVRARECWDIADGPADHGPSDP